MPGGISLGTSFMECTAMSARPFGHRQLQLLDEQPLAADLRERAIENAIALRRHRHQRDVEVGMRGAQLRRDVLGLPQREAALARRDTQSVHRGAH